MNRAAHYSFVLLALFVALPSDTRADEPAPLEFQLTYDSSISAEPFTGRVYVMLSKAELKEFRGGVNWFKPDPIFALDVKNLKAGQTNVLRKDALAFPNPMEEFPKGP